MRRFVDLHTHSSASDGAMSPQEIVRLAEAQRLAAVALTDHDSIAGLAPAAQEAAKFPQLRLVRGVELSVIPPSGTLHILGLGVDERCGVLNDLLGRLRDARDQRNPRILQKLRQLGLDVAMEDVLSALPQGPVEGADRIVGRLHIAAAMMRKGYVRSVGEAFDRYIGSDAPAFVDKERITAGQAIAALHAAGAVAVLAHPVQLQCDNSAQLMRILKSLVRDGLDAVEVYHTDHSAAQTRLYLDLARRLNLGVTGGSDFHGPAKPGAALGRPRVPASVLQGRLAEIVLGVP